MKEINYWNDKNNCLNEAVKYKCISDLQRNCYGCYMGLKRNGWLYDIFPSKTKPVGYWDKIDNIIVEAKRYRTKKDFRKHCKSGYNAALKNDCIAYLGENVFIKDDKRFNDAEKRNNLIYVYEIKSYNACYIGRTINLHERDLSHRRGRRHSDGRITYDSLYIFCCDNSIDIPSPIIKEKNLNARESLIQEDSWVTIYKDKGWKVLNIAKTGEHSGSLGLNKQWTYDKCKEFCKDYIYKCDLRKANYQCYYVCLKNGWFDEFGIYDKKKHPNGFWNCKKNCLKAAMKCKNKTDFIVNHQGAYKATIKHNWIEEINKIFQ